MDSDAKPGWYSIRCVFVMNVGVYEERIVTSRARSFKDAIQVAEAEGDKYATLCGFQRLDFAQVYFAGEVPQNAASDLGQFNDEEADPFEVFSLIRTSLLESDEYLDHFFATGDENQREITM